MIRRLVMDTNLEFFSKKIHVLRREKLSPTFPLLKITPSVSKYKMF
jgi:hypothetical protein